MSRRLYEVLQRFAPRVEPYSIDEMFLDLDGLGVDLLAHGRKVRAAVLQETKIPTCVGIGETKTKAKLANFLAKKRPEFGGVCDLRNPDDCAALYPTIPLQEVWGIGRASAGKLQALGLETVADLASYNVTQGRNVLTVTGARVIMELQGQDCLELKLMAPQRKGLAVTRTFGSYVTEWDELKETVSTFATRAGEKLREHGLLACAMTVFIQTNRFVPGEFYSNAAWLTAKNGTSDQVLSWKTLETILDEAEAAGVAKPVRIYATGNTAPLSEDLYRFHQIPNSILARLGILDKDEEVGE